MKSENCIFFIKSFRTSKMGIYRYFGVRKNSYAGTIISRIYDYYCSGAKNLFLEYMIFYRKEFFSYKEFLVNKYNIDEKNLQNGVSKRIYYKNVSNALDVHIGDFSNYKEFAEVIKEFIGWQKNEN